MCVFDTLFSDHQMGYVVACAQCRHIQIGFGNVQLVMELKAFEAFRQEVCAVSAHAVAGEFPDQKTIVLKTACAGYRILLSETELKKLHHMIEMADSERQALELIRMLREGE